MRHCSLGASGLRSVLWRHAAASLRWWSDRRRLQRGKTMLAEILSAPNLGGIVVVSLAVSLSATALACIIGIPFGSLLAVNRFPGRELLVLAMNALLGLPPVVVGLVLYLSLSRAGPLGSLGLLFTPGAMVLAQAVLATPIVTALVHRAVEQAWIDYGDA